MSKVKFKEGDKVYYPNSYSTVIHTLQSHDSEDYPLQIKNVGTFTENGNNVKHFNLQVIFHATQENYELLSKLYPNVSFEPPPKRKEPREIIEAMKNAGHKYVLCKAQNLVTDEWETVIAMGFSTYDSPDSSEEYMYDYLRTSYYDYFPINSKGEKIIDFVDGEVVLEDLLCLL